MGKLKSLLSCLLLLMIIGKVSANHITSGELRCTNTGKANEYLLGLKIYRNCSGNEFCSSCPGSLNTNCSVNIEVRGKVGTKEDSLFRSFPLWVQTESSAKDALNACKHEKSICSNCGTRTPGTQAGVEIYYFEGLVNLEAIPSNVCEIVFSYQACCRNSSISNILKPDLQNFYIQTTLNRCLANNNNSVVFLNNPIIQACVGTDILFRQQAIEPDGDSLSFTFVPLKSGPKQNVSYLSPYSYRVPFGFFGAPDTLGFGLNPMNGNINLRSAGSFIGNFALEVCEWRNIGGMMKPIASVEREFTVMSYHCPNQNPPTFYALDQNRNKLLDQNKKNLHFPPGINTCYYVVAEDSEQDSTDIFFNDPIPLLQKGLTIQTPYDSKTRGSNGPRFDTLKICWNPSFENIQAAPYYLTLFAEDRSCKWVEVKSMFRFPLWVSANPLGIEQSNGDKHILLYPNPVLDQLFIQSPTLKGDGIQFRFIHLDGRVLPANYKHENSSYVLNTESLEPGLWLLEIVSENFHFYKRFFHQN